VRIDRDRGGHAGVPEENPVTRQPLVLAEERHLIEREVPRLEVGLPRRCLHRDDRALGQDHDEAVGVGGPGATLIGRREERIWAGGPTVGCHGWTVGRSGLSITYIASFLLWSAAQFRRPSARISFLSSSVFAKALWNCLR